MSDFPVEDRKNAAMNDDLHKPRWLHRAWAWLRGFFWLPCPVCGREFGGQEWRSENTIHPWPDEPWRGRGVCSHACRERFETRAR